MNDNRKQTYADKLLKLLRSSFVRRLMSVFFGFYVAFLIWCICRKDEWNWVFLTMTIVLWILDEVNKSNDNQIKKEVLIKCLSNNIGLLTNELTKSPLLLTAIIKILNESETMIFELCDCGDKDCALENEGSKAIIRDHIVAFEKHQANKLNTISINEFIEHMSKVKTSLLNTKTFLKI